MKPIIYLLTILIICIIPLCLFAQATSDFNWIPSGKIEMGNPTLEARAEYWSDSPEIISATLPFAGVPNITYKGRNVSSEKFTVTVGTYRRGPCKGSLVIRRNWDTSQPAVTIKVNVDKQELPDWTIPKIEGDKRWVQLFYVVPEYEMMEGEEDKLHPKEKAIITMKSDKPITSYGYTFFITKDAQLIIGNEFIGSPSDSPTSDVPSKSAYFMGICYLGLNEYEKAIDAFNNARELGVFDDNELARPARRMLRLANYKKVAVAMPPVEISQECFKAHYLLGLYCAANGFWEEALDEFQKAVTASPNDAEATYRLAEAMEHNRLPIEEWAPLMERSGDLYQRKDFNTVDIFIPIQMEAYEGRTGKFTKGDMDALYRDWRFVEQQVWGASRGTYKMRTHYKVYTADDVKWYRDDWAICPPEEEWGEWGTYDQSVITAGYGDSGACGPDVGFAGCGYAQIGPTRGWEVLLHEWNHEFDWTGIFGETLPGYPATHDSDGCGKQPIVNMGCGHRSSMYYYITPEQYKRHETSDPIIKGSHIKTWNVGGLTPFEMPKDLKGEAFEKWLVEKKIYTQENITGWKAEWQRQWDENQKKEKPDKMESWDERLANMFKRYRVLDTCAAPNEKDIASKPGALKGTTFKSPEEFIDLMKALPDASEKAVAYAEAYIWSPADLELRMWLGMNDTMKVWLNGENIHRGRYYACVNWDDSRLTNMVGNTAFLKKGWNRIVSKVERGGGGWGFAVSLTTLDNTLVEGLKYQAEKPNAEIAEYQPPKAGVYYKWDDVKDDYVRLLPTLFDEDLRNITGLTKFETSKEGFFFNVDAVGNSKVIAKADEDDRTLNNYLNWRWEYVAAVRYNKGGETRDLLFIRPEYYEEYMQLLPGDVKNNILGTALCKGMRFDNPQRYVLIVDTQIKGEYPLDEQDLLEIKTK